jgi:hypothetical protein
MNSLSKEKFLWAALISALLSIFFAFGARSLPAPSSFIIPYAWSALSVLLLLPAFFLKNAADEKKFLTQHIFSVSAVVVAVNSISIVAATLLSFSSL